MAIILIIILALFLRAHGLNESFNFSGEFGQNLLDIKNAIAQVAIPLTGPATSHPWLSFGPFYYWLGMALMLVFGKSPFIFAYLGVVVGVFVVIVNYFVIKKIFNEETALASSFLISISPLFINFARNARFYSFVLLIFYPFVLSLYNVWNNQKKHVFYAGLWLGIMFSFHFSPLIFIPVAFSVFIKKALRAKDYLMFFLGIIIPNITLLGSDARGGFTMLKNLIVWISYRILGFIGFVPQNNATKEVLASNLLNINQYLGGFPISILVILCVFYLGFKTLKERKIDFGVFFIFSSLLFGLSAVFIHGNPPIHYFLPILPIPILVLSLVLKRKLLVLALLFIFIINVLGGFPRTKDAVPYKTQIAVGRLIINDAKGQPFTLSRVGPYDYFVKNYSQNYQYLLWMMGNEPKDSANLNYTIYENGDSVSVSK